MNSDWSQIYSDIYGWDNTSGHECFKNRSKHGNIFPICRLTLASDLDRKKVARAEFFCSDKENIQYQRRKMLEASKCVWSCIARSFYKWVSCECAHLKVWKWSILKLQIVNELSDLHSKNAGVVDKMNHHKINIQNLVIMSFFIQAPVDLSRLLKV